MIAPSMMTSASRRFVVTVCFALLAATAWVHANSLSDISVVGHALHRLGPVGKNGWGETDADGDGRSDLVTSADGPAALILVYGRIDTSSTLALKQSLILPQGSINALATAATGGTRVITVAPDGTANRYGGWPLASIGSFMVTPGTKLARIGDIDADGTLDLVCAGDGTLSVYNLADGTPKWSMPLQVTDIVLAQLDADPALELIIAGGDSAPGFVLDGATRMVDWARRAGFGTYLAAGAFGDSLEPGFVGARDGTSISGFSVTPYAVDWTIANSDTDGVAAGDTDADGRDEYAIGDGQWGSIRVYDTPYRQLLYQMPNMGHGIWALGMLDFDADARDEVWYSARIELSSNYDDNFAAALMNPITARPRLTIESYRQGATATLFADLDQDGRQEWVIGTRADSASRGLLRTMDAATSKETWRAPYQVGNLFEPFQMGYRSLHAAQLDADPALELIAIGGNSILDFRFIVIDGITRQVERQVPQPNTHWYVNVTATRLVQHVPGGAPELLVARHYFGVDDSLKLDVYSLPAGELIWSSPPIGGRFDRSLGLDVGQLDADPSPEYLLVHTLGLSAFDAVSGQTQWTLPMETQGAVIVPTQAGPRILSFTTQGAVARIDPQTLVQDGGFSLPAPLEQLVRLPGLDDWLLAVSGERLKLINLDGYVLKESAWIGSGPGVGDSLDVVREGSGWLISIGRSFTTFQLRLEDFDVVFASGFE